jgi:hypothetical protein
VGLAYPGARLKLEPGGFASHAGTAGDALRRTDEAGQFRLPANPDLKKVMAVCPWGYAEATPEQLATEPVLQLRPWGRVTGTLTRRARPMAGIRLRLACKTSDWETFALDYDAFQTRTDAAGHFVFEQVPPGAYWVKRPIKNLWERKMAAASDFSLRQVTVRAGETTEVQLGRGGCSVTLRPNWFPGSKPGPSWQVGGMLFSPQLPPPAAPGRNDQAARAWYYRPDVRAAQAERYSWPLETEGDGVWFAEGLPPGRYVLQLWAVKPGPPRLMAQAKQTIVIPADPPTDRLDLGVIPLQSVPAREP